MATKYISKINKIRIFICFYQNKDDKFNSNIFLRGGGGGTNVDFCFQIRTWFLYVSFMFHLVYSSGSSIHLTWKCIFKDYSRSLKCLVKSTFPVWLLGANNQKMGENIRSQTLHTKKNLFVRINVDISSVLTNASRPFLSPNVKHLWCFKLHIICLELLWLKFTCCSAEPRQFFQLRRSSQSM